MELSKKKEIILYITLSFFFAITVQHFPLFKGNSLIEIGYNNITNWDVHLMYRF